MKTAGSAGAKKEMEDPEVQVVDNVLQSIIIGSCSCMRKRYLSNAYVISMPSDSEQNWQVFML